MLKIFKVALFVACDDGKNILEIIKTSNTTYFI
jgi:hypothetical protein